MSSRTTATTASVPSQGVGPSTVTRGGPLAVTALRVALGFIFLWAFLDKTFGLNYSTPGAKAWINGGSPTNGFLKNVSVGPLQSFFNAIAGTWWANLGFMVGLLAIGVGLILGIGLRLSAIGATIMMAMMWAAEWPLAQFTSTGASNGSSNPLIDYHVIYALTAIVLAVIGAGRYFGLGAWWERMTHGNSWLR